MKVTLQKVLMAHLAIRAIEKEKASNRFAYGIAKNKAKMRADIAGIEAAETEITELEEKRLDYCLKHCTKDKDGKPLSENGEFVGIDKTDPEIIVFVAELKKLQVAHADLLKSETEIDFHMIDFKDVPDQITPADFENLSIFIKEPENSK